MKLYFQLKFYCLPCYIFTQFKKFNSRPFYLEIRIIKSVNRDNLLCSLFLSIRQLLRFKRKQKKNSIKKTNSFTGFNRFSALDFNKQYFST